MNLLIDLDQILIGKLGRATGMFLAWPKHSKLILVMEKVSFPDKAGFQYSEL